MRHLKIPYSDVLSMPTYERRFFLTTFINETEKKKEKMEEEQTNSTSSSNGKRTTKVSGDQLKARLKSGEIPNQ
jgi:hypothetical protein